MINSFKRTLIYILVLVGGQFRVTIVCSQNIAINNTDSTANPSAILDVNATDKGLLIPRLTSQQRNNIASPAQGLFIYNRSVNKLELWNGTDWIQLNNNNISASNPNGINTGSGVAIANSPSVADPSAILDIQSSTGGLLLPRMSTTQRDGISAPLTGLLIYNTTTGLLNFYTSSGWQQVCGTSVSTATGAVNTLSNVGINTSLPDPSAILDITSFIAGMAIPRLTSVQRNAVLSPAQGLMLFNTTTQSIEVFDGNENWLDFAATSCLGTYCTLSSTCAGTITDSRDNQQYNTIQIVNQCWMSQNLNVGVYTNGNTPQTSGGDNQNTSIQKYCFGNAPSNCDIYGGMYEWDEMMTYGISVSGYGPGPQGICPTGWHIPTDNEWKCLEMNAGMDQANADATGWRGTDEGDKLREAGTTHWTGPNTGATNSTGFTALPGGGEISGSFANSGWAGAYWVATETDAANAYSRHFHNDMDQAYRFPNSKIQAYSIRCVKN